MSAEQTLLVMDDDPYAAVVLGDVVRQFGYLIELARSSEEAIEMLRRRRYAGILADAWLERCKPEGVLAWMQRERRAEPVILMSEAPDEELWVEALNRGAADLIAKPVRPAQLQRSLWLTIERRLSAGARVQASAAAPPPAT